MKKNLIIYALFFLNIALFTPFKIYSQGCSQFATSVLGDLTNPNLNSYDNLDGDMIFDIHNNLYSTGYGSYFITKYSKTGVLKWSKVKATKFAVDIEIYNNKFIYVTGKDLLLCKFDSSGTELITPVNILNTVPSSMCLDNSGNIYITGIITGNAVFGSNTYIHGSFIAKFNSLGQLLWSKNITTCNTNGCTPPASEDNPTIISDGTFLYTSHNLISNSTSTLAINVGLFSVTTSTGSIMIKSDLNGNTKWVKNIPITNGVTSIPYIFDMAFTNTGRIIASSMSTCVLIDTTGTIINYYNDPNNGFKLTHVKTYNNKFTCIGKTTMDVIFTGDLLNPSQATSTVFFPNTNTSNKCYLVNFDKNGILHGLFPSAISTTNLATIDLLPIRNFSTEVLLVKYNSNFNLLPEYSSKNLTCGDDSVQLGYDTYSSFIGYTTTFNWNPTIGLSNPTIQNPKCKPLATTIYTVSVNNTCPTTVSVTVDNPSSFTYTTNGMVASFTKNGSGCNTFVWDFGNGNTSSINPSPTVTYASAGTYGVCLQCNGQSSSCVQCVNITVPTNGVGGVGVHEIQTINGVTVSPNPTTGILNIDSQELSETEVVLYNTNGKKVYYTKIYKTATIDLSNLSNGIYYLQIKNESGVNTEKVILNK